MKKITIIIFMFFILSPLVTLADEEEEILASALEKQNYQTLQAEVIVETTMEGSQQKMVQEYKYIVKKPDKVKMEITKPFKQTMAMSDGVMSMKMPDGKITRQKTNEIPGMGNMNLQSMQTMEGMKEKYVIAKKKEYSKDGKGYVEIELKPKEKGILPQMIMVIEKGTGKVTGSKVLDEKGNVIMESENESIEEIAGIFIPVEIRSVSKAKIGEKEIKMITRMRYENVKVNEKIKEKEFEVR
jgi:outer membrane lipoprotein-sorting protein